MATTYTTLFKALLRKKPIERTAITSTRLDRCLSTLDLTTLGIGSTLGLGVYVLAGQVASVKAGPAVTVSFFIAAVASVFAGLCYAEFGARVPKSGSAYVYSYITVGEFMAFVIGWNLILEYAIGSASIARGYSGYVDTLCNNAIQNSFKKWAPLNIGTTQYFDFFAFGIAMLIAGLLAVGVKKSTRLNAIFTAMNVLGVIYAIICGSFKVDLKNWNLKEDIPAGYGTGGFLPYGFSGMMAGAATCFYGFIGFDMIATTGEEVKNPARSIPLSIIYSLLVIFICYCGVSAIQTLMWPYYDQNQLAPLPYVFNKVGYPFAGWILTAGAMAGLYSSLLGTMYPLTRVLYSMGNDKVIFSFLSRVHYKLKTPHWATLFSGVFSGFMAALFEFQELADMMSIGTLLAYALVSISVLILRYQKRSFDEESTEDYNSEYNRENDNLNEHLLTKPNENMFRQIFNLNQNTLITKQTSEISRRIVIVICVIVLVLALLLGFLQELLFQLNPYALISVIFTIIVLGIAMTALKRQPQTKEKMSFKVPWVPLVPVLSVFVNIYLMLNLSVLTWIRFGVWMALGMLMYFLYGIVESIGYLSDDEKKRYLRQERSPSSSFSSKTSSSSPSPSFTSSSSRAKSETLSVKEEPIDKNIVNETNLLSNSGDDNITAQNNFKDISDLKSDNNSINGNDSENELIKEKTTIS